ncbi:hypothetical protein GCM10029963_72600 [Micromonospora andamanensis]|uniref:hypothetical protein n=1 Tax=Micromonospora andamanensis TaxID=1287068 RepID=UPI00194E6F78|nr:hypothetical protein [Micromonospora andamanensis]
MEAARRVDRSTGTFHLFVGIHAGRRSSRYRRPCLGDGPSPARLTTGVRRTAATCRSAGAADLGRVGTTRPITGCAAAHRAASGAAADPATARRTSVRGAADPASGLLVTRNAARASATAAISFGAASRTTGAAAAHGASAAGRATDADGIS